MASLLATVIRKRAGWDYIRRLLAAFAGDDGTVFTTSPGQPDPRRSRGLVEALSERELEVLRLLATDLDGPDIARRLFVSVNTMRTHTRSIYAKLGVNSRRAAVSRAEELHLLARSGDR
jgi:LuxR family maltose regulon positive regulatory protein